ncbi:MAG TPA: NAD(+) diphosphatase [Burkholderiales bacterium]|nr:NAD(+) diphosphatase [Burkholderiales bacterium]
MTQTMPFMSPLEFEPAVAAPAAPGAAAHWFVFRGDRLLVQLGPPSPHPSGDLRVPSRPAWARLPDGPALQKNNNPLWFKPERALYLGRLAGADCWTAELPADAPPPPPGLGWEGLRTLFSVLEDAHFALAGRAIQLLDWDRNHRFCGRCGAPTQAKAEERSRICPACRLAAYPRISPAVMALVRREGEILLGRSPHFPPGMFSALAGFVEPGETLEQCLAREVEEEVGVRVSRVRYFASQPWPFPNSLMIAFVCDWESGEIRPQAGEIEAANWFKVLQLPKLPSKISIARRLIDGVVAEMLQPSSGANG